MAERIVSPGVFTRERDLSFLPTGVQGIGAVVVGATERGPAFTPTVVTSVTEFNELFGDNTESNINYYVPLAAREYFNGGATSLTVVRTLHLDGYIYGSGEVNYLMVSSSIASGSLVEANGGIDTVHALSGSIGIPQVLAVLAPAEGTHTATNASAVPNTAYSASAFTLDLQNGSFTDTGNKVSFNTGGSGANTYIEDFFSSNPRATKNGDNSTAYYYLHSHFQSSSAFRQGNEVKLNAFIVNLTGSLNFTSGSTGFSNTGQANTWTGNKEFSAARTPYIQSQLIGGGRSNLFRVYTQGHGTQMNKKYFVGISDIKPAGEIANSDYGTFSIQIFTAPKDEMDDDRKAPTANKQLVQTISNCSMDPLSSDFVAKKVGDKFFTTDSAGKVSEYGQYPLTQNYVRIGDYDDLINDNVPKAAVPMGFDALNIPVTPPSLTMTPVFGGAMSSSLATVPTASFNRQQLSKKDGQLSKNPEYYGFNFHDNDNLPYFAPIPYGTSGASTGNNVTMSLEDMFGSADVGTVQDTSTFANASTKITLGNSHISQRRFAVPMQWGFDGNNPHTAVNTGVDITGTNTFGFNISSTSAAGYTAFKRAVDTVADPEIVDFNLLLMPGVNHNQHSAITNYAISKVEDRADAFFILDPSAYGDSISTTKNTVQNLDTNYAGCYYPWVRMQGNVGSQVWVPPSVVIAHAIANNDAVASEWFAPAGLNRGGLSMVASAETKLRGPERDDLYDNRINPIAHFTNIGYAVFGQKTLQSATSALDRINVRRLLINVKKFVASSSRYLVFEQNDLTTRNRFLNIVNPYLESIQQARGLSAFKVVMDDTNNTPDVVDRNQLVGQILLQPTRTAEFIVLDFVVLPTGAAFPE